MDSLIHDLSGALRHLQRNLSFVIVAVLILALGIGPTTAVFSVTETLLLRPLPYPGRHRLATLRNLTRVGPTRHTVLGVATAPVRFPPVTADFQLGLASVAETIDFWTPEFVSPASAREPYAREFDVVGKLRPGVTVEQAQREMDAI